MADRNEYMEIKNNTTAMKAKLKESSILKSERANDLRSKTPKDMASKLANLAARHFNKVLGMVLFQ